MAQRDRKHKHPPASADAASKPAPAALPRGNPMLWAAVILMAYLGALLFRSDRIPAGLNNDVAEEALRGLYLVNGASFRGDHFRDRELRGDPVPVPYGRRDGTAGTDDFRAAPAELDFRNRLHLDDLETGGANYG